MSNNLTFLGILAHPDDESLGMGGTFAKYSHEGIDTYLICATRGERGRFGTEKVSPGLDIVGETRTREVLAASEILGIKKVFFLDYIDGDLDQANSNEISQKIANIIIKIKPQVVATFSPEGGYGHPDHIAISQFSASGIVAAAAHHIVSKLYYMVWDKNLWDLYETTFKKLVSNVDGVERQASPWKDWAITTQINAREYWETVWQAVQCHKTQMSIYGDLQNLEEDKHRIIWGDQQFYRVFSLVNGGRTKETDLFQGLR